MFYSSALLCCFGFFFLHYYLFRGRINDLLFSHNVNFLARISSQILVHNWEQEGIFIQGRNSTFILIMMGHEGMASN